MEEINKDIERCQKRISEINDPESRAYHVYAEAIEALTKLRIERYGR